MEHQLLSEGKVFNSVEFDSESEFEQLIVRYSNIVFGHDTVYLDVKKKIGVENIVTIPDGYLIDFTFEHDPKLYIVENELVTHDPYKHIGTQILKFAISYKASGRKIKAFLFNKINEDSTTRDFIEQGLEAAGYRNIDAFLEDIIFDKEIAAVVVIDQTTDDLTNVLNQLTLKTDILEFQAFSNQENVIFRFTPFQQEVRDVKSQKDTKLSVEELDTIVVPANEDGFKEVFIGQKCWYKIRISASMLTRIKFIAVYQTAPISAITYFSEVDRIEKYKDSDKYIVYFKDDAKKIGPIVLPPGDKRGLAPRSPRYTNNEKLISAKTMADVF